MIITQTDAVPTTLAESTILEIRETNTYTRVINFKNLTDTTLSIQIEESADGGSSWTAVGSSFTVVADALSVQTPASTNIMRIRCSGKNDDYGIEICYSRMLDDATYVWTQPVL